MTSGTRVSWTMPSGTKGCGQTITDESGGHIQVAVDPESMLCSNHVMHVVIWCAVTWLTVVNP